MLRILGANPAFGVDEAGDAQALRDVLEVVPVVEFVGVRREEIE
jgi:hypothetical protein